MTVLAILIPASLLLGGLGLVAFLWTVRSEQYDDLEGASWRILMDDLPPDAERAQADESSSQAEPQNDQPPTSG